MKILRSIAAAAAAVVILSSSAQAQAIGIQGLWGEDTDLGLEYTIANMLKARGGRR